MAKNIFVIFLILAVSLAYYLFRPLSPDRVDSALDVCHRLKQDYYVKSHYFGSYAIICIDSNKKEAPAKDAVNTFE